MTRARTPTRLALAAEAYSPRELTEGERWTADALLELRRDRYRPRAWRRFIARSLRRSAESRRARPEVARQARRWGASGAVAWVVVCRVAGDRGGSPSVGGGLLWWGSVWRMLDWHLGMAEGGDGKPRARLSEADAVTLLRFWLVPLLPAMRASPRGLPLLIAAGGLTDWADGALARHRGRTRLGRDLDTTADLAFLGTAAISAVIAGRLPPASSYALAGRYAAGIGLSLGATFARARRPAIRARRAGAVLRLGGLVLTTAGWRRTGDAILVAGCLTPPRSTAGWLSPV